jgi:DNA-binding response OmpR family regulator
MRVLVVDDDAGIAELLLGWLAQAGYILRSPQLVIQPAF